jgi:hypothetical protein
MSDVVARRLDRIRSEYLEMPGLCLTVPQARRLWGFDHDVCSALLRSLVQTRFLTETRAGTFIRCQEHIYATPQPSEPLLQFARR